jgi:hypothetical protein
LPQNISSYIKERLDDQILWYEKKSASNKLRFRITQVIIIIASAIIPIINLSAPQQSAESALFTTAILGTIVTIVAAFSQMEKYFETWILYRTTVENLKRERFLYMNDAADYSNVGDTEKDRLLIERVEALLSSENSKFFALQQQQQRANQQQQPSSEEQKEKKVLKDVSPKISSLTDSVVKALSGISFPKNRQDILNHIEQNKGKIENADSVIKTISVLPARDYNSLKDFENELLR